MPDGDLFSGPVTGKYNCLFQREISNIPTVTPTLCHQTRRITRHNVSVTRYKSVIKKTAMTGQYSFDKPKHKFYINIFII